MKTQALARLSSIATKRVVADVNVKDAVKIIVSTFKKSGIDIKFVSQGKEQEEDELYFKYKDPLSNKMETFKMFLDNTGQVFIDTINCSAFELDFSKNFDSAFIVTVSKRSDVKQFLKWELQTQQGLDKLVDTVGRVGKFLEDFRAALTKVYALIQQNKNDKKFE